MDLDELRRTLPHKRGDCRLCTEPTAAVVQARLTVMGGRAREPNGPSVSRNLSLCEGHAKKLYVELADVVDSWRERERR